MLNHILQMLKIAEQYDNTETIAIAKGRYEYTTNYLQLFKKASKMAIEKVIDIKIQGNTRIKQLVLCANS
jgi:hypothetical protein